jgi:hypothetical protein
MASGINNINDRGAGPSISERAVKRFVYRFEGSPLRHMDQMPDYSEMPFAANRARPSGEAR